jgi:hypothetical protein
MYPARQSSGQGVFYNVGYLATIQSNGAITVTYKDILGQILISQRPAKFVERAAFSRACSINHFIGENIGL